MQMPRCSSRRLVGVAVLACATVLAPIASLVGASPGGPASAVATPTCTTSGLVIWMNTEGNGTAGSVYYNLEFTNLSGHTCTMFGYPGVSAVNLAGAQLGSAAHYSSVAKPAVVTIADGATASAVVQIVDVGVYPGTCVPAHAAGLRVYPPDQTAAKIVPFPFLGCTRSGPIFVNARPVERGMSGTN
jgi:hypothetical protein